MISSILSCPASKRFKRFGTWTRGLAEPNTVPISAWLYMAKLKRLSWTSIW